MSKLIKNLILIVLVLGLAVAVFSMYNPQVTKEENNYEQDGNGTYQVGEVKMQKYWNADLGLSFAYRVEPDGYTLIEKTGAETGESAITHSYVLRNTEDYEEILASGIPTDGPPTISITIFENPDNLSPQIWAEKNPRFSLVEVALSPIDKTELGGAPAINYKADGLYVNDMYVVNNNFKIYIVSGGYLDSETKFGYYEKFLESLKFF